MRYTRSYLKTIRLYLGHLVNLLDNFFFFSIGNNRNILVDGTDERKYLQRKYNEL